MSTHLRSNRRRIRLTLPQDSSGAILRRKAYMNWCRVFCLKLSYLRAEVFLAIRFTTSRRLSLTALFRSFENYTAIVNNLSRIATEVLPYILTPYF